MDVNDAFPSKYMKAADLEGKRVSCTINYVEMEKIGRGNDMKPIVYFVGKKKGLCLNKTNANKIAAITGTTNMDDWSGKVIQVYATDVEFAGELVQGIRVAGASNGAKQPAPAPKEVDDDDVPF